MHELTTLDKIRDIIKRVEGKMEVCVCVGRQDNTFKSAVGLRTSEEAIGWIDKAVEKGYDHLTVSVCTEEGDYVMSCWLD